MKKKDPEKDETSGTKLVPCKFYAKGMCTQGALCPFLHVDGPSIRSHLSICPYFLKGNCRYGNECALLHELPRVAKHSSKAKVSIPLGPYSDEQGHIVFKVLDVPPAEVTPELKDVSRPTTTWTFACIRKEHSDDETSSKGVAGAHIEDFSAFGEDVMSNRDPLESSVIDEVSLYSRMARLNLPVTTESIKGTKTSNDEETKGSNVPVSPFPYLSYPSRLYET
jgi:hypothetical protein